jgi:hypothetical protein
MRISAQIPVLLSLLAFAFPSFGSESPQEVFLSDHSGMTASAGKIKNGEIQSFVLKITNDHKIVFEVDGDNAACEFDLKRTRPTGSPYSIARFPASIVVDAISGEQYTLSFTQNERSRKDGSSCMFTFSIAPKA